MTILMDNVKRGLEIAMAARNDLELCEFQQEDISSENEKICAYAYIESWNVPSQEQYSTWSKFGEAYIRAMDSEASKLERILQHLNQSFDGFQIAFEVKSEEYCEGHEIVQLHVELEITQITGERQ